MITYQTQIKKKKRITSVVFLVEKAHNSIFSLVDGLLTDTKNRY